MQKKRFFFVWICHIGNILKKRQDGKLKEAVILSKAGEPCNLRYGNLTFTFKTTLAALVNSGVVIGERVWPGCSPNKWLT